MVDKAAVGEVRSRSDGYRYEKQADGSWKRLRPESNLKVDFTGHRAEPAHDKPGGYAPVHADAVKTHGHTPHTPHAAKEGGGHTGGGRVVGHIGGGGNAGHTNWGSGGGGAAATAAKARAGGASILPHHEDSFAKFKAMHEAARASRAEAGSKNAQRAIARDKKRG